MRLGSQQPRLSSVPAYVSTAGDEAIDLAADAGLVLDPWQRLVLRDGMGEVVVDGALEWSAFEVACVVPRQNGKGAIIEALCLAGLFLAKERLTIYSAHEFKTAQETYRRIDELIAGTPWLSKQVKRKVQSTNESGFELHGNRRLRFLARSKGSGRGFSARKLIFDEAYDLPAISMGAIVPTLAAQPNPQIWYFSSAGQVDSDTLRGLRDRGLAQAPRLAYFEWSATEGSDPGDREAWAQANPGLGIRIAEQFVEDEQRALTSSEWARERLGAWDDPDAMSRVIPYAEWNACADRESVGLDPVAFAVDVDIDRTWGSIVACGMRSDGLPSVTVVEHRPGTDWIVPRLVELNLKWHPGAIVVDKFGPVGSLLPALEVAGIEALSPSTQEVAQACGAFFDAAMNAQIRHRDEADLNAAVQGAKKRPLNEAWAWARKTSGADVSPLVAATLALWARQSPKFRTNMAPLVFDLDDYRS